MQARSRTEKARDDFLEKLKRRHITGSHESAKKVVELLRDTASATKWSNCAELMDVLKGFIQPFSPLIAAALAVTAHPEPTTLNPTTAYFCNLYP